MTREEWWPAPCADRVVVMSLETLRGGRVLDLPRREGYNQSMKIRQPLACHGGDWRGRGAVHDRVG